MDGSAETARECAENYLEELEELTAQCVGTDRESVWILALLRSEMERTRSELAQITRADEAGNSLQKVISARK